MRILLSIFVILFVIYALPASARGQQQPLTFSTGTATGASNIVIEQLNNWPFSANPIVNPLSGCSWDVNDYLSLTTSEGYLDPGAGVAKSVCMVSGFTSILKTVNGVTGSYSAAGGHFGMSVQAPSPDLHVTACYSTPGRCFTPGPIWDSSAKQYVWIWCSQAVYVNDDPVLMEIPGSNGGIGVITTITLQVQNLTGRRVKNIRAGLGVASAAGLSNPPVTPGCSYPLAPKVYDYPFSWVS